MRTDTVSFVALGLVCRAKASSAPMFSSFDPPDEGQTNPLFEGMEDIVESELCEALTDESDMIAERLVVWDDPVDCIHGPGELPMTEEPLCRAHDTDGCLFCREKCSGTEDMCVLSSDVLEANAGETTEPATPDPVTTTTTTATATPTTTTAAPVTTTTTITTTTTTTAPTTATTTIAAPSVTAVTPVCTSARTATCTSEASEDECGCVEKLSQIEAEVLKRMGKTMICDTSCSNGSDLVWNVVNCNYFGLGQNCRACADTCIELSEFGVWLDQFGYRCKPCSAVVPKETPSMRLHPP